MFNLTKEQIQKVNEWHKEQTKDKPYTGAIGGQFTYSFSPNNLGLVTKVKNELTGEVLDVTDYSDW